jgi:hypothetical protein
MRPDLLLLALLITVPAGSRADTEPVLETPHFAFHSDFDTNLEDALELAPRRVTGRRRGSSTPDRRRRASANARRPSGRPGTGRWSASQMVMFTRIVFFGALPMIFAGLRVALGVSFIVIVAAEFVAAKEGIGQMIWSSWDLLQVDRMFVGIVSIGILGVASTALLQEIERLVLPWKNQ